MVLASAEYHNRIFAWCGLNTCEANKHVISTRDVVKGLFDEWKLTYPERSRSEQLLQISHFGDFNDTSWRMRDRQVEQFKPIIALCAGYFLMNSPSVRYITKLSRTDSWNPYKWISDFDDLIEEV